MQGTILACLSTPLGCNAKGLAPVKTPSPVQQFLLPPRPRTSSFKLGDACKRSSNGVAPRPALAGFADGSNNDHGNNELEAPSDEQRAEFSKSIFKRILTFMGPAILIPLGDPLMSLVDTVCIGQFCDPSSLAAMGPANMIKSFATYILQSLQVTTLTIVASHLRDKQRKAAARTLSTALMLAATCGLLTTILLSATAKPLVVATGVRDAALLPLATDYLRIRSVAQPAVLATMVAQAGLLAQQDSVTPSLSVAISVAISILGNLVFVLGFGYGLYGAGITTVATQISGALILLWALHSRKSQLQPHWSAPHPKELLGMLQMMVPLTVVSLSKNLCYLCVSTTAATLRTLCLAAHQASFTVWCLGTWSTSPLEQACMTFLPSAEKAWQQKLIGNLVLGLGLIVAAVTGGLLYGLLQFGPGMLVRDLEVQRFMQHIAPQAMISMALVGIDVAATAVNLACRDFTYMARSHLVTLSGTCLYFWHCRKHDWGLGGVWWGLVLFFFLRAGQSLLRAFWILWNNRVIAPSSDSTENDDGGGGDMGASEKLGRQIANGGNGTREKVHEGSGRAAALLPGSVTGNGGKGFRCTADESEH